MESDRNVAEAFRNLTRAKIAMLRGMMLNEQQKSKNEDKKRYLNIVIKKYDALLADETSDNDHLKLAFDKVFRDHQAISDIIIRILRLTTSTFSSAEDRDFITYNCGNILTTHQDKISSDESVSVEDKIKYLEKCEQNFIRLKSFIKNILIENKAVLGQDKVASEVKQIINTRYAEHLNAKSDFSVFEKNVLAEIKKCIELHKENELKMTKVIHPPVILPPQPKPILKLAENVPKVNSHSPVLEPPIKSFPANLRIRKLLIALVLIPSIIALVIGILALTSTFVFSGLGVIGAICVTAVGSLGIIGSVAAQIRHPTLVNKDSVLESATYNKLGKIMSHAPGNNVNSELVSEIANSKVDQKNVILKFIPVEPKMSLLALSRGDDTESNLHQYTPYP